MKIEEDFPLRFFVNLGRREDRRAEMEWILQYSNVNVERFPAVDARFISDNEGFFSREHAAIARSILEIISEAKRVGAKAVLILQDDVILHPNINNILSRISLPADWGMFNLGCRHVKDPVAVDDSLVRVTEGLDLHAWAISESVYDRVAYSLRAAKDFKGLCDDKVTPSEIIKVLQREISTYAVLPNVAWQSESVSDVTGYPQKSYGKAGAQLTHCEVGKDLLMRIWASEIFEKKPKIGLLFLTKGDLNQPNIWREWIGGSGDRVSVYSHVKEPGDVRDGFLKDTIIDEWVSTEWGDVSLVRATLALLKAALVDQSITHFVLVSESCVPVIPLKRFLLMLELDGRSRFGFKDVENSVDIPKLRFLNARGVHEGCWRFHQQWFMLDRVAVKFVLRRNYTSSFKFVFACDEGYFGTALCMEGFPVDDLVYNQDITWTKWETILQPIGPKKRMIPVNPGSPLMHTIVDKKNLGDIINRGFVFARKFSPESDVGDYGMHI